MEPDRNWDEETVSLGGSEPTEREVDHTKAPEGPEPRTPDGSRVEEDVAWGTETVLLGSGEAGRVGAASRAGRREPPRRRARRGAVAGAAIAVLAIALISLSGGGGNPNPQPVAPTVVRGAADRRSAEVEVRVREERRRRGERRAKAARIARERRRLRERRHRRHKAAKNKVRSAPLLAPVSEPAPEYAPEPGPQTAPAPEAAPPPAPSPTPPGVEFGM